MEEHEFDAIYRTLNTAQRRAVDAVEGPVMVVAGPGTGKTQVLAMRIANILVKTDTPADGILCLTFTNSGVSAMRERLRKYIGTRASQVVVATFHSFGLKLLEEFYYTLDLPAAPRLMDDSETITLYDDILEKNTWQHLRPRGNATKHFQDLKSVVSLLKRERVTSSDFKSAIDHDIDAIKNSPESISSRGASKGQLKKEAEQLIERLERTREVVAFYDLYEAAKSERNLIDYDDVLELSVRMVEISETVRDSIRERYLYVLVDEHQDSSAVQNEFLRSVWGGVESPNLFVVGDDRQLIYGFGGASLDHFQGFREAFGDVTLVTLVDNYRSTDVLVKSSDALLRSALASEALVGKREGNEKIKLVECDYSRDEILACAEDFKQKIADGIPAEECALLVPKNSHVRNAATIFAERGLPVASHGTQRLLECSETQSLIRVLEILENPTNAVAIASSLLDPLSGIPPIEAHVFLRSNKRNRQLTLDTLVPKSPELLPDLVATWGTKLSEWLSYSQARDAYAIVQKVGNAFLVASASDHDALTRRVEIVRTMLHLALAQKEKQSENLGSLSEFLQFLRRLRDYGQDIPLAVFSAHEGVRVMTLHSSKGLEFDAVWIAHMDERSLMSGKSIGFTLPETLQARVEEKTDAVARREVYVAITRAKRFCTISYARKSFAGNDQSLARILADLPDDLFEKQMAAVTEDILLEPGVETIVENKNTEQKILREELQKIVAREYPILKISATSLNNFYECPWKWYFGSLLDLPEPISESLEFGSVVHGSIESILKSQKALTPKMLREIIQREVDYSVHENPDAAVRMVREAEVILTRWIKNRLPHIASKRETERPLSVATEASLTLTGKIDLIEYLDEQHVRVTDFKTGSAKTKSMIEKADDEGRPSSYIRQLAMYSHLLETATRGNTRVAQSQLEFVESSDTKNALYTVVIGSRERDMLAQDITDYDRFLKSGDWMNRPCNFNAYGRAGAVCENCALARKIYGISTQKV